MIDSFRLPELAESTCSLPESLSSPDEKGQRNTEEINRDDGNNVIERNKLITIPNVHYNTSCEMYLPSLPERRSLSKPDDTFEDQKANTTPKPPPEPDPPPSDRPNDVAQLTTATHDSDGSGRPGAQHRTTSVPLPNPEASPDNSQPPTCGNDSPGRSEA